MGPKPLRYTVTLDWSKDAPFVERRLAQEAARAELAQAVRRHQELEQQLRGPAYRPSSPAWRTLFVSSSVSEAGGARVWTLEAFPSLALFQLATEIGDLVWPGDPSLIEPGWAVMSLVRRGFEPVLIGPAGAEFELWRRVRLTD